MLNFEVTQIPTNMMKSFAKSVLVRWSPACRLYGRKLAEIDPLALPGPTNYFDALPLVENLVYKTFFWENTLFCGRSSLLDDPSFLWGVLPFWFLKLIYKSKYMFLLFRNNTPSSKVQFLQNLKLIWILTITISQWKCFMLMYDFLRKCYSVVRCIDIIYFRQY